MKGLLAAIVSMAVIQLLPANEMKFVHPFATLKPGDVDRVEYSILSKEAKPPLSWMTTRPEDARKQVQELLKHATPQDYPVREGPIDFATPSRLIKVEFKNAKGHVLAEITMLGAWNLLETKGPGMRKPVLGSNRLMCDRLLRQLFAQNPEAHEEAAKLYKEALSGRYPKEYRDILDAS